MTDDDRDRDHTWLSGAMHWSPEPPAPEPVYAGRHRCTDMRAVFVYLWLRNTRPARYVGRHRKGDDPR